MPLELLQKIAKQTLPLTVTDIAQIDKLRVLQAAGHVVVRLSSPSQKKQLARVESITPTGHEALLGYAAAPEEGSSLGS